jgi:hypothetical protein
VEKEIAGGVVHIGSDPDRPWKNKTLRSTNREALVARTGSGKGWGRTNVTT